MAQTVDAWKPKAGVFDEGPFVISCYLNGNNPNTYRLEIENKLFKYPDGLTSSVVLLIKDHGFEKKLNSTTNPVSLIQICDWLNQLANKRQKRIVFKHPSWEAVDYFTKYNV